MEDVIMTTTISIDIAKSVFHVHGVNAAGEPTVSRKLRRAQVLDFLRRLNPCLAGMEACATSHHWAREIAALGHDVRLMPPQHVKPYVKRQKNDAADAAAICEAVERTQHEVRSRQVEGPAGSHDVASGPRPFDPPKNHAHQCFTGTLG